MTVTHDDVVRWIRAFADAIAENKDSLTDLDSAIGDADHGINMHRGMTAVLGKLDGDGSADIGTLLKTVGMTLVAWGPRPPGRRSSPTRTGWRW